MFRSWLRASSPARNANFNYNNRHDKCELLADDVNPPQGSPTNERDLTSNDLGRNTDVDQHAQSLHNGLHVPLHAPGLFLSLLSESAAGQNNPPPIAPASSVPGKIGKNLSLTDPSPNPILPLAPKSVPVTALSAQTASGNEGFELATPVISNEHNDPFKTSSVDHEKGLFVSSSHSIDMKHPVASDSYMATNVSVSSDSSVDMEPLVTPDSHVMPATSVGTPKTRKGRWK
ncbi:hypothetical protein ACOSQ3_012676 [Xanthoceras sorbifolium]